MTTALICGVSGQDGAYLADLLLKKGYRVVGTSRDAQAASFANLSRLGIREQVECVSMVLTDFRSTLHVFERTRPDEVYCLAGQSSVLLSFEQPVESIESITLGAINLLEAIRFFRSGTKLYHASSSECFGDTKRRPADEDTPFHPRSPYAVAKAAAHWAVANYREAYGLFACNGILFNHDSPLRPDRFVTKKVIAAAHRISKGEQEKLVLGDIRVERDWGWAPDFVDAMWRIMQHPVADDFVVATGQSYSLEDFVARAFAEFGLDWRDKVELDTSLRRPTEIMYNCGNADKARRQLGWTATHTMPDIVRLMAEAEKTA
jgi:GDPmannose 4,6-dehydratase